MKHSGYRTALFGAESLIETRMYRGLAELWPGLRKNLVVMAGGTGATLRLALTASVLAGVAVALPGATFVFWRRSPGRSATGALIAAWAASLAMVITHMAAARRFRNPVGYGLLFPLGYAAGSLLALDSALRWRRGSVAWKGRRYVPGRADEPNRNDASR